MRELVIRLAGVALLSVALPTAAAAATGPLDTFVDPRGDSESAPDVGTVAVDFDPQNVLLKFVVSTPNRTTPTPSDAAFVYVDLDPGRSPAVGRLEYELIIGPSFICRPGPPAQCARSWGFSYANADGRVTMTFRPERAVPIDFRVITVHPEDGRSDMDSAPDRGTSTRAQHWRIRRSAYDQACVVPNVRGLSLVAARRALVRERCSLGAVKRIERRTAAGRVLRQSPPARALLPLGGRVDLILGSRRN
jgi:hypothetical protein